MPVNAQSALRSVPEKADMEARSRIFENLRQSMKLLSHTDQKLFLPFSGKCLTEKLRSCILSISPLKAETSK